MKLAVIRLRAKFRCSTPVPRAVSEKFYTTVRDAALAALPPAYSQAVAYAAGGREARVYVLSGDELLGKVYDALEAAFCARAPASAPTIEGFPSAEDPLKDVELAFDFLAAELYSATGAADAASFAAEIAAKTGDRWEARAF